MNVNGIAGPTPAAATPTREEMIAIAAARPAVLQLQAVALAVHEQGTSGQGTPKITPDSGVDLYA